MNSRRFDLICRCLMKPGILGWAQVNRWDKGTYLETHPHVRPLYARIQEESLRLGYDLYYLEAGSPFMDCEIWLRALLRGW